MSARCANRVVKTPEYAERVAELASRREAFAIATVTRTEGSTLAKPGFKILISSRVEVVRGLRHRERDAAEGLMRTMRWSAVDEQIARRAGALGRTWRRSHSLATADLIIAATAQELGVALATSNVRHFPMFPGLRPPYEVAL